eukprot:scaffold85619_cov26-Phaeocystis_antarctica.AAC.2
MGLRTGPIQEGSQPGPRLDRKARARKDPKARGTKPNQGCKSRQPSSCATRLRHDFPEKWHAPRPSAPACSTTSASAGSSAAPPYSEASTRRHEPARRHPRQDDEAALIRAQHEGW